MSIAEEIQKLHDLHRSGAINDEEFAKAKAAILGQAAPVVPLESPGSIAPAGANWLKTYARSNKDYWLGGVCGGLGEHTPVPSWAWRVGFCMLLFVYGIGLVPYVLLWIFAPTAPAAI